MVRKRKAKKPAKETIVVFCAHNDDQIIGVGGTLAKYIKEGKRVITAIFSYGAASHPHYKEKVAKEMRQRETMESTEILGKHRVITFGLKDGSFNEEMSKKGTKKRMAEIIKKYRPSKIFTHSLDDPHPDHRAVYSAVKEVVDKVKYKGDVYSFNVWNFLNIRKRHLPKMVVDITGTFDKKIYAFKAHRSQRMTMITLMWNVYFQAVWNGIANGCKYAEIFSKIR